MASLLDDPALVHEQDSIGVSDRAETMGDEKHRTPLEMFAQICAHLGFGLVIEGAGSFIHDQ